MILCNRRPGDRALLLAAVGLVTFLTGLAVAPTRAWGGLLAGAMTLIFIGLAGALGLAIEYALTGFERRWLRRVPAAMTTALPLGGALLVLVLLVHPQLYSWVGADLSHAPFKAWWLQRGFHLARTIAYLAVWTLFARGLVSVSQQRESADSPDLRARHTRLAVVFFYVLGVTLQLAAYDWLMSLEPLWYSTIFGLYQFGAVATAGVAMAVLLLDAAGRDRPAEKVIPPEQLYDLGQLLFGLCCFWVYIWFSQFLLIWYVNLPEETTHYIARLTGAWAPLFYLNTALGWLIPFLVLLPREAKRSLTVMRRVALVVLAARVLDLALHVGPAVAPGGQPGVCEFLVPLGALGAAYALARHRLHRAPAP